jgi:myo-inositol 2-dehydrogenase/D-chiro-inositol 1-dehydrogenase
MTNGRVSVQREFAVNSNTPDNRAYSDADGVHSAKPLYFFLERYMESFLEEMRQFISSLINKTTPPVTGIDGRIPVLMGLAAKRSYLEKRPVRVFD